MKKILKRINIVFLLIFLILALIYVSDIDNLPSNVILFEGETLRLNTIFGVEIETEFSSNPNIERVENYKAITVTAEAEEDKEQDYTGTVNLNVKLLGAKVKEINVNVIEKLEVVPLGNLIGVKLYTNGVLVVGMSEISGTDNNKYKPYEGSGIEEGDVISKVNEKEITCTNELTTQINKSNGEDIDVTFVRNRRSKDCENESSKSYG